MYWFLPNVLGDRHAVVMEPLTAQIALHHPPSLARTIDLKYFLASGEYCFLLSVEIHSLFFHESLCFPPYVSLLILRVIGRNPGYLFVITWRKAFSTSAVSTSIVRDDKGGRLEV